MAIVQIMEKLTRNGEQINPYMRLIKYKWNLTAPFKISKFIGLYCQNRDKYSIFFVIFKEHKFII